MLLKSPKSRSVNRTSGLSTEALYGAVARNDTEAYRGADARNEAESISYRVRKAVTSLETVLREAGDMLRRNPDRNESDTVRAEIVEVVSELARGTLDELTWRALLPCVGSATPHIQVRGVEALIRLLNRRPSLAQIDVDVLADAVRAQLETSTTRMHRTELETAVGKLLYVLPENHPKVESLRALFWRRAGKLAMSEVARFRNVFLANDL